MNQTPQAKIRSRRRLHPRLHPARKSQRQAIKAALAGLTLISVGACAPTAKLAEAGPYVDADGSTVRLGRSWSDVTPIFYGADKKVRVLSIDGPALNTLFLATNLSAGDGLVRAVSKDKPVPTIRKDMSDSELVEFVLDSVAAMGYQRPEAVALRPSVAGGAQGLRFDLASQTTGGLEISGTAQILRDGAAVHTMLYLAPKEYYYKSNLKEIEGIFQSLTLDAAKKPKLTS